MQTEINNAPLELFNAVRDIKYKILHYKFNIVATQILRCVYIQISYFI